MDAIFRRTFLEGKKAPFFPPEEKILRGFTLESRKSPQERRRLVALLEERQSRLISRPPRIELRSIARCFSSGPTQEVFSRFVPFFLGIGSRSPLFSGTTSTVVGLPAASGIHSDATLSFFFIF